jgi:hypothetical protein
MTGAAPEPTQEPPGIAALTLSVTRARTYYQACRYAELITRLPRQVAQLNGARSALEGDDKLRAYALTPPTPTTSPPGSCSRPATTAWPT